MSVVYTHMLYFQQTICTKTRYARPQRGRTARSRPRSSRLRYDFEEHPQENLLGVLWYNCAKRTGKQIFRGRTSEAAGSEASVSKKSYLRRDTMPAWPARRFS